MRFLSKIASWAIPPVARVTRPSDRKPNADGEKSVTHEALQRRRNRELFAAMRNEYIATTRATPDSRNLLMARTQQEFDRLRADAQFEEGEHYEIDRIYERWLILNRARTNMNVILNEKDTGNTSKEVPKHIDQLG